MIELGDTETGLRAVDADKNEVSVQTWDWAPGGPPHDIARGVEASATGTASQLGFPEAAVCVDGARDDQWETFVSDTGPLRLPKDSYLIQVETTIAAYVRFESEAILLRHPETGEVRLSFPVATPVTVGFRSRVRHPIGRLVVPPTIEGVATAVTHFSAAHTTTSPDRSYPTLRQHPPLLEFGEEYRLPQSIQGRTVETGIELWLPRELSTLYVAAPLAFYLQASINLERRSSPRLVAPAAGIDHVLKADSSLPYEVADLLRRVFFLDCLVRNEGRFGTKLAEQPALDALEIDAEWTYEASPSERLATYLEAPFKLIDKQLPDWHLAMHVDPTMEFAPVLPHFLDRLSLVYPATADPLERRELITRSLDELYRVARSTRHSERGEPVDLLQADFHRGRVHGWLAAGMPIDVFKALTEAYDHRFDHLGRSSAPVSVTVVLNDADMRDEQATVSEIYRKRSKRLSIDIEIEQQLECDELAAVFERPTDFVHYIGHCDGGGLQCTDGQLHVEHLDQCRAQTFFLNACRSYHAGLELVRKGSVAGAVTLRDVIDEQATKVGTVFARLLIHGFSIDHALRLARRCAVMNKLYAAVGDGTHRLSQGDDTYPVITEVRHVASDTLEVQTDMFSSRDIGGVYQSYLQSSETHTLVGNQTTHTVSATTLCDYLSKAELPVLYQGQLHWSDELAPKLLPPR